MRPVPESDEATISPADFTQIAASAGYKQSDTSLFVKTEGDDRHLLIRTSDETWSHLTSCKGQKGRLVRRGRNWAELFRHVAEFHGLEW